MIVDGKKSFLEDVTDIDGIYEIREKNTVNGFQILIFNKRNCEELDQRRYH